VLRCTGTFWGSLFAATGTPLREIAFRLAFRSLLAAFRGRQLYASPPRLRQSDGDSLLWRSGAMFALPDVFQFLTHKLARLRGRRFAFAFVFARPFFCFFFWYTKSVSPLIVCLDVMKTRGDRVTP